MWLSFSSEEILQVITCRNRYDSRHPIKLMTNLSMVAPYRCCRDDNRSDCRTHLGRYSTWPSYIFERISMIQCISFIFLNKSTHDFPYIGMVVYTAAIFHLSRRFKLLPMKIDMNQCILGLYLIVIRKLRWPWEQT